MDTGAQTVKAICFEEGDDQQREYCAQESTSRSQQTQGNIMEGKGEKKDE